MTTISTLHEQWRTAYNNHQASSSQSRPHWVNMIAMPLLNDFATKHNYELTYSKPLGIGSRITVTFAAGLKDSTHGTFKLTFEPDLESTNGSILSVVDYNNPVDDYEKGSVGEINGFNYPIIGIDNNIEISEIDLFSFV
jgi:hypothetical protein